jgi:biopolymer transport protein ExbB
VFEQALTIFRAGGWVMYPLLALSVLAVTLVFERSLWWSMNLGTGKRFALYLADLAGGRGGLRRSAERARKDRTPLGALIRVLDGTDGPITDGAALAAIESLRPPIERSSATLGVIIAAAPLLGILGTVTGIIQSFDLLGDARSVTDPVGVAGGIAEALYTTAFGLTIALIAVFPHAFFRARSERMLARLESLAGAVVDARASGADQRPAS